MIRHPRSVWTIPIKDPELTIPRSQMLRDCNRPRVGVTSVQKASSRDVSSDTSVDHNGARKSVQTPDRRSPRAMVAASSPMRSGLAFVRSLGAGIESGVPGTPPVRADYDPAFKADSEG